MLCQAIAGWHPGLSSPPAVTPLHPLGRRRGTGDRQPWRRIPEGTEEGATTTCWLRGANESGARPRCGRGGAGCWQPGPAWARAGGSSWGRPWRQLLSATSSLPRPRRLRRGGPSASAPRAPGQSPPLAFFWALPFALAWSPLLTPLPSLPVTPQVTVPKTTSSGSRGRRLSKVSPAGAMPRTPRLG